MKTSQISYYNVNIVNGKHMWVVNEQNIYSVFNKIELFSFIVFFYVYFKHVYFHENQFIYLTI